MHFSSFLAGAVAAIITAALLYYGAIAFQQYVDNRAREAILDVLKGYPLPNPQPPPKSDS